MPEQPTTDADKLETLAEWLDVNYPNQGDEVQRDLRRIAAGLRQAVEALEWYAGYSLAGPPAPHEIDSDSKVAIRALASLNGEQDDE